MMVLFCVAVALIRTRWEGHGGELFKYDESGGWVVRRTRVIRFSDNRRGHVGRGAVAAVAASLNLTDGSPYIH